MQTMKDNGFIMLSRRFFDHDLWDERRKFSRAEAFIDLIQSANFAPKKVLIGNTVIPLERGQQVASLRFLGQRWGWSTFKVKSFLKLLFEQKMAYSETKHQQTVLTLCNYDTYNSAKGDGQTQTKRDHNTTITKQKKDKKERSNNSCPKSDEEALALWKIFPRKSRDRSSQKQVKDAYRKATNKPPIDEIAASLRKWVASEDWQKEGGQYALGAHRWINNRQWESTPEPARPTHNSPFSGKPNTPHPFIR
jgi:hypothetical protein